MDSLMETSGTAGLCSDAGLNAPPRPREIRPLLERLLGEAEERLQAPLRPLSENHQGYLETVAIDPAGNIWISGWIKKGQPLEFAAVLVDRQKFPAAVVLTSYDRPDLPDDAHALFGVILTSWRPASTNADIFVFFGEDMRFYLRSVKPLRVVDPKAAMELFEGVRIFCDGTHTSALQRMLTSAENWLPDTARVAGFPVQASVDDVLVVPGFGCFAQGWIISPVKRIHRLALKLGSVLLHAPPEAIRQVSRDDLRPAFPHWEHLAPQAGFVAMLRGDLPADEVVDPLLKVVFTDGSSVNFTIETKALRRIGHSAPIDSILDLYPSLPFEPAFADFAAALSREAVATLRGCNPVRVAPASRAAVFVLPSDRSDLYLLFEEVLNASRQHDDPPGFVFIGRRDRNFAEAAALFHDLEAAGVRGCSLFLADDPDYAFYELPGVLNAVAAERFLFAAAGVFLTPDGWSAALRALQRPGGLLHILADCQNGVAVGRPDSAAQCFVWSASAFAAWLRQAPIFVGGFHGDNLLLRSGARLVVHGNARRSIGQDDTADRLVARVNAQIAAAHGGAGHA